MKILRNPISWFVIAALLPLVDALLPREFAFAALMRPVFIFAVVGLGLHVVTGYVGLLNLGVAAFMALGAYGFAILTCDIYPFQLGFWSALLLAAAFGVIPGILLGVPTLRLRGDYLAIVTLGFGEIVADSLRNLEAITKGTQGINPLPPPYLPGVTFAPDNYLPWYYLFLGIVAVLVLLLRNIENSRVGREWIAIREDELAASCMGIRPVRTKLFAFAIASSLCALGGALWASYLGSSGEPGNYDFQVSVIVLCSVIVGGLGSLYGVLLGAVIMVGFNSIVLVKLSDALVANGLASSSSVFAVPNNWKYAVFGLALVLMMRFRPHGVLPSKAVR